MSDDIIKRLRFVKHTADWEACDEAAALLTRLDKAERENERLREDAERYRWLRGREDGRYMTVYAFRTDIDEVCLGDELDSAIDAARAERGKE